MECYALWDPYTQATCTVSNPTMQGLPLVNKDPEMKELRQLVKTDTPMEEGEWPLHLKGYFVGDAKYSMAGNTIFITCRVIIPRTLRAKMLAALHHDHPGILE